MNCVGIGCVLFVAAKAAAAPAKQADNVSAMLKKQQQAAGKLLLKCSKQLCGSHLISSHLIESHGSCFCCVA